MSETDVIRWVAEPTLKVSWGEVFDKLTILKIKLRNISNPIQRENISYEMAQIEEIVGEMSIYPASLNQIISELEHTNTCLWDIENKKRACEEVQKFDEEFIQVARSVYIQNDRRAKLKKLINEILKSKIVEEKSHQTNIFKIENTRKIS